MTNPPTARPIGLACLRSRAILIGNELTDGVRHGVGQPARVTERAVRVVTTICKR